MKTAAILAAAIAPIVVITAVPVQAAPPPSDRTLAMARIGETVRVGGTRVTPLRVIEDSRCPQNARCVWAGRVRLSARIGHTVRELVLGQPVPVSGGTLGLAAVLPERTTREGTIPPRAYRFGFRFQRSGGLELVKDSNARPEPVRR